MIKLKDIINEVKLQKGKTYGGTKCEGGCFVGKEGLKKIIKISKDSPKDVFMFRDDNYSGLQPHFVKDGVIAKATVLNPAYDLEKHKVRNLNIGKDVILSVRLFVSTNESVNEGLYHVGYNKGRGQGTGVFKDSYSSYKDAKKAVEKLEKERGGSYNQIAYYVSDKDGKFVKESISEATEIELGELPIAKAKKIFEFEKILGGKHTVIFDGIHGLIVDIETKGGRNSFRFESNDLRKLLSAGIRWVEADGDLVSIGF